MTDTTTMSIRLSAETKERLERLAGQMKRSKSFLAAEAIAAYVERELEIVEGIERGLDDMRADRVVTHADAMARLRAGVDKRRKAK
jgi:predicted transcriptional regulator